VGADVYKKNIELILNSSLATIRRTSGQCLGTFKPKILFPTPPHYCSVSHNHLPTLSLYLSLSPLAQLMFEAALRRYSSEEEPLQYLSQWSQWNRLHSLFRMFRTENTDCS
jgi:hypothetical protein